MVENGLVGIGADEAGQMVAGGADPHDSKLDGGDGNEAGKQLETRNDEQGGAYEEQEIEAWIDEPGVFEGFHSAKLPVAFGP